MSLLDPAQRVPLESIPVFPLPGAVLFPAQQMPLHIFEPRYRQMTRDVLEGAPYLVIARLTGEGEQEPPAFSSIATVGKIVSHTRLADGRYNLLLEGTVRVAIEEIPFEGLYRRVKCTALREPYEASDAVSGVDSSAMMMLVGQVMQKARSRSPELTFELPRDVHPAETAFRVADRLIPDPATRQQILGANSASERVKRVTSALAHVLSDIGGALKPGAGMRA